MQAEKYDVALYSGVNIVGEQCRNLMLDTTVLKRYDIDKCYTFLSQPDREHIRTNSLKFLRDLKKKLVEIEGGSVSPAVAPRWFAAFVVSVEL